MYTLEIIEVLWRGPSSCPGQNTVKIPKTANMLQIGQKLIFLDETWSECVF